MATHRIAWTVVLAIVFTILGGLIRPVDERSGMPEELFWSRKMRWSADYDIVLAGDSRILASLRPTKMKEVLANHRIANFGFLGCGLSEAYLRHTRSLLDPNSLQPVIVLDINPSAMTPLTHKRNTYTVYAEKGVVETNQHLYLGGMFHFLRPYQWNRTLRDLGLEKTLTYARFCPDGSVVLGRDPENPRASEQTYRKRFVNNQVDPKLVKIVLNAVSAWSQEGILVYGFRPPVPETTLAIENQYSGFDEAAFVEKFARAGGRWIRTEAQSYRSHDGSHLRADAALRFSEDFARIMKARLPMAAAKGTYEMASSSASNPTAVSGLQRSETDSPLSW